MLYVVIGIILLYLGAQGLVRGSPRLAANFGIRPRMRNWRPGQ